MSAKLVVTTLVSSPAAERHDVARAADDLVLQRPQRRLALLGDLDVDALVVEPLLQVGQPVVGVADDAGHVVAELARLVGDRVGERDAEADDRREQPQVDGDDSYRPWKVSVALEPADQRVEDQREDGGEQEDEEDLLRRVHELPQGEDAEGEDDELDPARDDDLAHWLREYVTWPTPP